MHIPGCSITGVVHNGRHKTVYRGSYGNPPAPVVIKVVGGEVPSRGDMERLRREYRLSRNLSISGITHSFQIVPHELGLALVQEDGGESLRTIAESAPIPLDEIL